MVDQKPPRIVSGERETLQALLQYQRESVVRKTSGVSERDARRQLVPSGTSLLWLVKHLADAESLWMQRRFAGLAGEAPPEEVEDGDSLTVAIHEYRRAWVRTDQIIGDASLDEFCQDTGTESPVTLRW